MNHFFLPICCQTPGYPELASDLAKLAFPLCSDNTILLSGHHPLCLSDHALILRPIRKDELRHVLAFQKSVLDGILHNQTENLCEALTERELLYSVEKDVLLGLFHGDALAALLLFIPHPLPGQNLLPDLILPDSGLTFPDGIDNVIIVDCILVHPDFRGYGIQHFLFRVAECCAKKMGIPLLGGVANPKNSHSHANFIRSGYELVATRPKYRSVRNYYLKRL